LGRSMYVPSPFFRRGFAVIRRPRSQAKVSVLRRIRTLGPAWGQKHKGRERPRGVVTPHGRPEFARRSYGATPEGKPKSRHPGHHVARRRRDVEDPEDQCETPGQRSGPHNTPESFKCKRAHGNRPSPQGRVRLASATMVFSSRSMPRSFWGSARRVCSNCCEPGSFAT
jgi:hypothetical protein